MIRTGFQNIQESYLFSEIGARVRAFQAAHPEREIVRMGIGDDAGDPPDPFGVGDRASAEFLYNTCHVFPPGAYSKMGHADAG